MSVTIASGRRQLPERGSFYSVVAIVCVVLVFVGFAPSFYLKGAFGPARDLSALTIAHGVVMTAWYLIFLVQTILIARARPDLHRRVGAAGAAVALLMVLLGSLVQYRNLGDDRETWNAIHVFIASVAPFFDFACLVGVALYWRRRTDIHRRLMLVATLLPLGAAIGRFPFAFCRQHLSACLYALILACIAFDTWKYRRLHPAFLWSAIFFVVMDFTRRLL